MEAVAAPDTTFFKSRLKAIEEHGLDGEVQDICITLGQQVHLIRPIETMRSMFLYVALERKNANLGMARIQVKTIESALKMRPKPPGRWRDLDGRPLQGGRPSVACTIASSREPRTARRDLPETAGPSTKDGFLNN